MTQETASATPALNGRDDGLSLTASDFAGPRIQLVGDVDYAKYQRFRDQLERSAASGLTQPSPAGAISMFNGSPTFTPTAVLALVPITAPALRGQSSAVCKRL